VARASSILDLGWHLEFASFGAGVPARPALATRPAPLSGGGCGAARRLWSAVAVL